jgi:hypothetical protein
VDEMGKIAKETVGLVRLADYTQELELRQAWGSDEDIDREFNAVCRAIWGYTPEDLDDSAFSKEDHDGLVELSPRRAADFAVANGFDLADYLNGGFVSDWWGFAWMILAEKRGFLTPEHRAATWKKHDAKLLANDKVIAVIRKNSAA